MGKNNVQKQDREYMARELYGMGFSLNEIADMLLCEEEIISRYIAHVSSEDVHVFDGRPDTVAEKFCVVMYRFAKLVCGDERDKQLAETIVACYEEMFVIINFLHGAVAHQLSLENATSGISEGYRSLLEQIFHDGRRFGDKDDFELRKSIAEVCWEELLRNVRMDILIPTVFATESKLLEIVARNAASKDRIVLCFSGSALCSAVDYAMAMVLTPREVEMITMRFGLIDDDTRTVAEIGEYFHLRVNRVRQIIAKALKKLREKKSTQHILATIQTVGSLKAKCDDLQSKLDKVESELRKISGNLDQDTIYTMALHRVLDRNIDDLNLSARVKNALWNYHYLLPQTERIVFVGDVAKRGARELRKVEGIGMGHIEEIKQALAECSPMISLGMDVRGWKQPKKV